MATKVNSIIAEESVPDLLVGGIVEANRFRTFTKAILTAFINGLIAERKNGIKLTGITGSTITNAILANRNVLLIAIDDFTYNRGFDKVGANDAAKLASTSVVFADLVIAPEQTVTILLD